MSEDTMAAPRHDNPSDASGGMSNKVDRLAQRLSEVKSDVDDMKTEVRDLKRKVDDLSKPKEPKEKDTDESVG